MNNLVKFGLIAVGGWLIWSKFNGPIMAVLPEVGTPDAVGTPGQNTAPTNVSNAPTLRAILLNAVKRAGNNADIPLYGFDEWNWFYANERAVPGPSWEEATGGTGDRSRKYAVDEYIALIVPNGFGGIVANRYESAVKSYVY